MSESNLALLTEVTVISFWEHDLLPIHFLPFLDNITTGKDRLFTEETIYILCYFDTFNNLVPENIVLI